MIIADAIELREVSEREEFMKMAERHFRELNPNFVPAGDWLRHYFDNIKKNPQYSLCWISVEGRRSGFVLSGVEDHRFLARTNACIYELYIVPEYRRRGIARQCAKLVLEELWKTSPAKIQLEVMAGNEPAARLWTSLGFEKVSERYVLARKTRTQ
jgi:ribosomal protein S18 acetylase RimI-like enzyme